jgi:hypothetical protein
MILAELIAYLFKKIEHSVRYYPSVTNELLRPNLLSQRRELSMQPHMPRPTLSKLEWSEVAQALESATACGCRASEPAPRKGVLARVGTALLRDRRTSRLMDPKLEAIRRFACDTYRRRAPADEQAAGLAAHGLNPAQIEAIALLSL